MKIRPIHRVLIAALVSTSGVAALDGCAATKKMANPEPTAASEVTPKKEYTWQDMSTGKSFFRPITPTPKE